MARLSIRYSKTSSQLKPILLRLISTLQRCIILKGTWTGTPEANNACFSVQTRDEFGRNELFPIQSWPVVDSRVKIIAMLTPGINVLKIFPQPG